MAEHVRRMQAENLTKKQEDPCFSEREKSLNCLAEYESSQSICDQHILNYKICKDFWVNVRTYRKNHKILPHLPPPEEREQIKSEFFEKQRSRVTNSVRK